MLKLIKGVFLLLLLFSQRVDAQNYYNSPYTRFNLGDMINSGFSHNRSMGGTSIALRTNNQINYLNPASYTAQDTNSFLFQIGFTSRFAKIQTDEASDASKNSNIEYLAIGVPVNRWLNFSAGLVPYSRIQYNISQYWPKETLGEAARIESKGFGGLNEFYVGGGVTIKKVFSIGVNLNYLFGSLDRTKTSYLADTNISSTSLRGYDLSYYSASIVDETNYIVSGFYSKIGVQYHPVINNKHALTIGATLDAKAKIKVKQQSRTMRYNRAFDNSPYQDTINYSFDTLPRLRLPNKFGVGISYKYDDKILVTAEYIHQDWLGSEVANSNFSNGLYQSYRIGAEYIPVNHKERLRTSYFKRMHYRIGGYYTKTSLYFNTTNITDKGLSAGLGFPWKNARKMFTGSALNIAYQYGERGTKDDGLIKEQYHFITFGITLHDFWFLKPKYD